MPSTIPLYFVDSDQVKRDYVNQAMWLEMSGFTGQPGDVCLLPSVEGELDRVLVGKPKKFDTWTLGRLARSLPAQKYQLADDFSAAMATQLCLGWTLGQYRFTRYKRTDADALPELAFPKNVDHHYITTAAEATYLVRDLVNTPAQDMAPQHLAETAQQLADRFGAQCEVTVGEDLLAANYPMVYAVGRASQSARQAPRLIDLRWGEASAPKVTLVGKGVCFDTGGLNMKNAAGMKLMKKDMGGAAQVLGLAKMIMQLALPVQLRVLVPAVENSIAGDAIHPADVLTSRLGKTVEIGNTDAEGRLILADALTAASSDSPALLIDCATLTGAARIAIGAEIAALFCNHDETAEALLQAGIQQDDPLWRLPLHTPYRSLIESKVADLNNIGSAPYGGAITAALFLREFIQEQTPWIHIDFMAYNTRSLPGRPEGGEAMGMRSLFSLIKTRFAT